MNNMNVVVGEEEGSRNGMTALLLRCIDHTNVKPLWFLWCKSHRKKSLITCPLSCCEDLQSSSSPSVPLSFLCKVELHSTFPVTGLASSHKPFKHQWFFSLKSDYWSTSFTLAKPSGQQEMEEEKIRCLWWKSVCSFLKDLRKHANILIKWNNIRLLHIYWVLAFA